MSNSNNRGRSSFGHQTRRSAFTRIELLIVVAIIAILAAIAGASNSNSIHAKNHRQLTMDRREDARIFMARDIFQR